MNIYIPTKGRSGRQITADQLAAAGIAYTLVLSRDDAVDQLNAYREHGSAGILMSSSKSISHKRQAILAAASHGKLIMLDDDLVFYARRSGGAFTKASARDLRKLFAWLDKALDKHAHAGVVDKFMSHAAPRGSVTGRRYNSVLAYNLDLWPSPKPRFRVAVSEEHDVHLQLATQGLPAIVSCEFSKSTSYYSKGGCSAERSAASELSGHKAFAALWPGIVSLVTSKTSISGFAVRTKWRAAAEISKEGA